MVIAPICKCSIQSNRGQKLLAHELTHTLQQRASSATVQPMTIQRKVKDFSESKELAPLQGKIEHYAHYAQFENLNIAGDPDLMSGVRHRYEIVTFCYQQLLLKLKQYNQIPGDDPNYSQHIALLQEIIYWINRTIRLSKMRGAMIAEPWAVNRREILLTSGWPMYGA